MNLNHIPTPNTAYKVNPTYLRDQLDGLKDKPADLGGKVSLATGTNQTSLPKASSGQPFSCPALLFFSNVFLFGFLGGSTTADLISVHASIYPFVLRPGCLGHRPAGP